MPNLPLQTLVNKFKNDIKKGLTLTEIEKGNPHIKNNYPKFFKLMTGSN